MTRVRFKKIRVFVASPNDVADERARLALVINGLNKGLADHVGVILEMRDWSDVVPKMGRGQQVILDQIPVETWEVMIGIFWHRYGMPSGGKNLSESGTHEEFNAAYESWNKNGKPQIMFYRCIRPITDTSYLDVESQEKINAFFKEFETGGKNQGLYRTYNTPEEFERLVRDHLEKLLLNFNASGKRLQSEKKFVPKATQEFSVDAEINQEKIDVSSPLLIGMVVDFSQPMADVVSEISEKDPTIRERISKAIKNFIENANKYCQAPKSREEILPRFRLFLYGYGLGNLYYTATSILAELISAKELPKEAGIVRDLFAEVAERKKLPVTPNASELHRYWDVYGEAINAQMLDIGRESPSLENALEVAEARIIEEMKRPHYKFPLLLILSKGDIESETNSRILEIADSIKSMGVEIACGYIGTKSILEPKTLYFEKQPDWPEGVMRLFGCASEITESNSLTKAIRQMAIKKFWNVPDNAKLFLQINQEEMLDELIDILTSPLKPNQKVDQ
jgi:hypothetical protein